MAKLISRIIWQLNRSPMRGMIKSIVRALNPRVIQERTVLARKLPNRSELDSIVSQLKEDGYCILTDLVDKELLQTMATRAMERMASADSATQYQAQKTKPFWVRLLDEEMEGGKIRISSPYVRFAIQPTVIQIIARVLGQIPRLDYVLLTLSQPTTNIFQKSQLWHLDYDDLQVIKLFVYITDVKDLNDGPFTFISAKASRKLGYSLRSHRSDDEMFANEKISKTDVHSMIAPALSVFMIDTARCYHMGSRLSDGHQRLLYTATFTTAPSMFPGYKKERFMHDLDFANEIEKNVLAG